MAGNKKIYTLDEYYKDRYGGQMAVSPLNRTASRSSGGVFSQPPAPAGAMQKRQQILSSMNPIEKPQQPTAPTQPAPTQQATGAASIVQQPEQGGALTKSQLTTADTMRMLEDALASLAEWGNRKFVYNAKESPLYTILQQQAEKEARLASGRAYSRAVANTGGFGSSYATLAAEEAGRQVMEGLDDQQLALYQAAREEFEAERQSRVDWYNTAKQLHNDRMALDELQAIEAAAKASGMNTDTYNLLQTAVAEGWYDGTNKATARNKLETMALGNPNINVDAIMTQLEGGQKAQMTDLVSGLSINPTLSGAAEIMAQAKTNGTEAEVLPEVSAAVGKGFEAAMKNPNNAYEFVGVSKEKWEELAESDRSAMILEYAAQAYSEGMLTRAGITSVIMNDVQNSLFDIHYAKDITTDQSIDVLTIVEGVMSMAESGMIDTEMENDIVAQIAKTKVGKAAYDYLTEKDRKRKSQKYSGMFKDIFVPGTGLDQSKTEALALLGKSISNMEGRYDKADAVYDKITSRYK